MMLGQAVALGKVQALPHNKSLHHDSMQGWFQKLGKPERTVQYLISRAVNPFWASLTK